MSDTRNRDHEASAKVKERLENPLIRKLESLADLSADDRDVLARISANPQSFPPGTDLIKVGDKPDGVYLILEGVACRYQLRANGARQIMAYLIPGDYCDLDVALLTRMDHSIGTLSAYKVVRIDLDTILNLLEHHPRISRAMRLATLVDEATLREWIVNIGRRSAEERIAHLLCELLLRHQAVGRAEIDGYALPLTQTDLADTTGLSLVHVNRTLMGLRDARLIELTRGTLKILDLGRLKALAEFEPRYLRIGGRDAA